MRRKWILLGLVASLETIALSGRGAEILWDIHHGICPYPSCDLENTRFAYLFAILEEEGINVVISDTGVLNLNLSQYDGLVLSTGNAYNSLYSDSEATMIEDFVRTGGNLLVMSDICPSSRFHINPVTQRFGVTAEPDDIFPQILTPIIQHPIFEGVERIALNCAAVLNVASPSISASANSIGEVGVAIAEVGQGRVIVTGDESLFNYCCLPSLPGCCESNDNAILARNLFRWLLKITPCSPVEPPLVRSQGYWRRQCKFDESPDEICSLLESVHDLSDHFDGYDCEAICDLMEVDPPENEMCRKAERQFMALLLNLASGKLSSCNCLLDGRTVEEVVSEIDLLLSGNPDHSTCVRTMSLAEEINSGESLVNCSSGPARVPPLPLLQISSPNPFRTSTFILYQIPLTSLNQVQGGIEGGFTQRDPIRVTLVVYDIAGRLVRTLVDGSAYGGQTTAESSPVHQSPITVEWDGKDGKGEDVPGGIYFSRLKTGDFVTTKKLILIR